jgi:hypothetical protein
LWSVYAILQVTLQLDQKLLTKITIFKVPSGDAIHAWCAASFIPQYGCQRKLDPIHSAYQVIQVSKTMLGLMKRFHSETVLRQLNVVHTFSGLLSPLQFQVDNDDPSPCGRLSRPQTTTINPTPDHRFSRRWPIPQGVGGQVSHVH